MKSTVETKNLKSKFILVVKGILTLWILFHLLVVLVMPNLGSYVGRTLQKYLTPYGNSIGLNASWNFFSPDPAHTMYLRYTAYFENENGEELQEPQEHYFPESGEKPVHDIRQKRNLYAMRFMILDSQRLKTVLGPWLCRQHPQASRIYMEHVIQTVAPLDEAQAFQDRSMKDLSQEIPYVNAVLNCHQAGDETL